MAKQLLFYERIVPLARDRHATWAVRRDADYSFAAETRALPLAFVEFEAAARTLPIVFVRDGGTLLPAAVLGFDRNTRLDAAGRWVGTYVPAFARRYPFVLSPTAGGDDLVLCIDEAFAGIDPTGATGTRIFADDGTVSAFAREMLEFARNCRTEFDRTGDLMRLLAELGLFEEARTTLNFPDGSTRVLDGFFMVDRKRLAALDGEVLKRLMAAGVLEAIHLHLWSLKNFDGLLGAAASSPGL
jgi:hypothetical protein